MRKEVAEPRWSAAKRTVTDAKKGVRYRRVRPVVIGDSTAEGPGCGLRKRVPGDQACGRSTDSCAEDWTAQTAGR